MIVVQALDNAQDRARVVGPAEAVAQVAVLELTANAGCKLIVGSSGDEIPLRVGMILGFCRTEARGGLFLKFAAQPGAAVTLLVTPEDSGVSVEQL